jgi:hypothetical protein
MNSIGTPLAARASGAISDGHVPGNLGIKHRQRRVARERGMAEHPPRLGQVLRLAARLGEARGELVRLGETQQRVGKHEAAQPLGPPLNEAERRAAAERLRDDDRALDRERVE